MDFVLFWWFVLLARLRGLIHGWYCPYKLTRGKSLIYCGLDADDSWMMFSKHGWMPFYRVGRGPSLSTIFLDGE